MICALKGVWHEIFSFKFFSLISFPPTLSIPLRPFRFFRKIRRDIREWMFISGVNDTGHKREKCWDIIFLYFVKSLVGCNLHLKIEFLLIFHFRCRQANIGRTVLLAVSLTPAKNLSAVSLTPLNCFLVISDRYQLHGGKMLSPVSTTPPINCSLVSTTPWINFSPMINCIDDRGLLFLPIGTNQWYLWPPKSYTPQMVSLDPHEKVHP